MIASVFTATTGVAVAQTPHSLHSGAYRTTESHFLQVHPRRITNDNPAGVIDGTNPNPNPTEAGGIRSPDALVNW